MSKLYKQTSFRLRRSVYDWLKKKQVSGDRSMNWLVNDILEKEMINDEKYKGECNE